MNKLLTSAQTAAGIYIYGLAGASDRAAISAASLVGNLIAAVGIFALLQIIKKPACGNRRTSRATDYQIKPKTI